MTVVIMMVMMMMMMIITTAMGTIMMMMMKMTYHCLIKFQESSINSNQDYLYLIVLDDYLNFLLPSDGSGGIVSSSSKSKASLGSVRKGLSSW